jgi:hypothetical protein
MNAPIGFMLSISKLFRAMRILMLSQFYFLSLGQERIVQDLSVSLAQRGHDVTVATLWHEGLA